MAQAVTQPSVEISAQPVTRAPRTARPPALIWLRNIPFLLVHVTCFVAFFTGVSWPALVAFLGFYRMRVFFVTGFYHRYFSHRTYKTSRIGQAVLAFLGTTALQKGPLWWAGHHRFHHRHSDDAQDVHSPKASGFWWAHMGWLIQVDRNDTREDEVRDLGRFPELRFFERHYIVGTLALIPGIIGLGIWMELTFPGTGVTLGQVFVWGFLVSTVALWHTTYMINSGAHMWGGRRYDTTDTSRNNWFLAVLTMGEGWHNNHHRYPGSERNGFFWYEIDVTHYVLSALSFFGLIWDLRRPPRHVLAEAQKKA